MLRIALAATHLLALGIGLGAIWSRARAMNALESMPGALRRAFAADTWWGIAAALWIGTGLARALAGTEKSPDYYWSNHVFLAKMGMLVLVIVLELWPMVTLIRWRRAQGKGGLRSAAELSRTGRLIARISDVQTLLVIGMVVAATMMARGYGARILP
jgi:putative membrane protein